MTSVEAFRPSVELASCGAVGSSLQLCWPIGSTSPQNQPHQSSREVHLPDRLRHAVQLPQQPARGLIQFGIPVQLLHSRASSGWYTDIFSACVGRFLFRDFSWRLWGWPARGLCWLVPSRVYCLLGPQPHSHAKPATWAKSAICLFGGANRRPAP